MPRQDEETYKEVRKESKNVQSLFAMEVVQTRFEINANQNQCHASRRSTVDTTKYLVRFLFFVKTEYVYLKT